MSRAWERNPLRGIIRHKPTKLHTNALEVPLARIELITAIIARLPRPAITPDTAEKINMLRDPKVFRDLLRSLVHFISTTTSRNVVLNG
jgi:hypothetical protein